MDTSPLPHCPSSEFEPYCYTPLPTSTSIRLIELLPSQRDEIICSIVTNSLDEDVNFDALSYTWGNPITIYEKPDDHSGEVDNFLRSMKDKPITEAPKTLLDLDSWTYRLSHPFVQYEKVQWGGERFHPIICNKKTLLVTENLFDALLLFRRLLMGDAQIPMEYLENMMQKPRSQYIWIDAICINQSDVFEKGSQVAMMSRIYRKAQTTYGWLGKTDSTSRVGVRLLSKLTLHISTGQFVNPNSLYSFGDVTEVEWMALFALLQRLWFRRVWIAQEAVFAQQLILICGGAMMRWTGLQDVLLYLSRTGLSDHLSDLAKRRIFGGPSLKFTRKLQAAGVPAIGFIPRQREGSLYFLVDPRASYSFAAAVHDIRKALGLFDLLVPPGEAVSEIVSRICQSLNFDNLNLDSKNHTPSISNNPISITSSLQSTTLEPLNEPTEEPVMVYGEGDVLRSQSRHKLITFEHSLTKVVSLLSLINMFRDCDASDPRDKIFALFGIASKTSNLSTHLLPVSYQSSAQDVYFSTAQLILQTSGHLELLGHVQDLSITRTTGLPSWVPDFSVSLQRRPFSKEGQNTFFVSNSSAKDDPFTFKEKKLIVQGVLLDKISFVAPSKGCYFVRTALAALHTNNGTYRAKHLLVGKFHSKGRPEPAVIPIYPKIKVKVSPPPMTRVEALWRTLMADVFENQYPAPITCGFAFSDWVCKHLILAENLEIVSREGTNESGKREIREKLVAKYAVWQALEEGEMGGFYCLDELERSKEDFEKGMVENSKEYKIDVSKGGMRFLPDTQRKDTFRELVKSEDQDTSSTSAPSFGTDTLLPKLPESINKSIIAAFEARIEEVKSCRRMFATEKGYLGMGTKSIEKDDEVWLLKGASIPMMLRRIDNGHYTLIGEAYVCGVDEKEALDEAGEVLREVIIV